MTVAWDVIKPAIVAFIESTGVVLPEHVVWEREAHAISYEDVIALRLLSEDSVGYDDLEDVEVSPGVLYPRITGIREFVLSIRFHSRSQVTAARNALETVRACFQHPRLVATLEDAGVAYLSSETLQTFDEVSDERWESIGVLDVRLGVVSEYFQPGAPGAPGTAPSLDPIESVDVTVQGESFHVE